MIKKLLSIVMLLALVATVSAAGQKDFRLPKQSPFKNSLKHATMPQMMKAPAALLGYELEPGQAWFGYWNPEDFMTLGTMCDCDYALAIYIPNKVAGQGATIDGMRFYLASTKGISNVKAWISTKLSEVGKYADGYDLEIKNVETLEVGYNEVLFDKKYEIPEGGLYVGFYFDSKIDMTDYPPEDYTTTAEYYAWYEKYLAWVAEHPEAEPFAVTPGDKMFEGTMYFASVYQDELYTQYAEMYGNPAYLQFVGWFDYSEYGYYLGAEALIGGDKFLKNAATLSDFGEKYASINQEVIFPVTITNSGLNGVQNFTYEVSINGSKVDEQTITLDNPIGKILDYTTVNIPFKTGEQAETEKIELTLTKVNGEANEKESVAKGTLYVLAESAKKKPFIEEYTGTWCGWCTRGWIGLEMLAADFDDEVVLVASHNGDPMEIEEYMAVQNMYIQGYPSMLIDRVKDVDPYYGSGQTSYYIKNDVEASMKDAAPVGITVKAEWADEEKTKINISTETKFFFEDENPSLAIGYILVADGLTGSGRSWAQANYYNEYAEEYGNDPYLGQLTQMDSYILDMTYNHVAVAGWGIANGVDGSISGPAKIGEAINGTFVADLNGVLIGEDRLSEDPEDHVAVLDLIQDKKLKVVAFLINQKTGEVVNADEVVLDENPGVSISAIEEKAGAETVRYNVSGQLIKAPQSGLNIIKLSDGTTLKVLVK
jgi:hypothetical protein